ncbi:hypothetical protein ACTFIV_010797 [Dictyostelium citrinum]
MDSDKDSKKFPGYVVLSNKCEPSFSVSSAIIENNKFNFNDVAVVDCNKSIDDYLKMEKPLNPMVLVQMEDVIKTIIPFYLHKKGFTTRFKANMELKSRLSAGFKGCEASFEVTTEGPYSVYQTVIVYPYFFPGFLEKNLDFHNHWNPSADLKYVPELKGVIILVPIYRDDPFTIHHKDFPWTPVEYTPLVKYLCENPKRWYPASRQ